MALDPKAPTTHGISYCRSQKRCSTDTSVLLLTSPCPSQPLSLSTTNIAGHHRCPVDRRLRAVPLSVIRGPSKSFTANMRIPSCFHAIPRQWRTPKTLIGFFVLELALTVAALALYGIAAPDLYRTKLWQEGSNHGWNSNPNQLIYAAANYRPVVEPLPWSQLYVSIILYSEVVVN